MNELALNRNIKDIAPKIVSDDRYELYLNGSLLGAHCCCGEKCFAIFEYAYSHICTDMRAL